MEKLTEVARSYSKKVNIGNYESEDFFCSQKEECLVEEAKKVSKRLFEFCKQQVEQDIGERLKEIEDRQTIQFDKVYEANPNASWRKKTEVKYPKTPYKKTTQEDINAYNEINSRANEPFAEDLYSDNKSE